MTSRPALRILTAFLAVCAPLAFAGEPAAQPEVEARETVVKADAPDPAELLLNIANFRTLRTKFVQTKRLKAFKKPMVLNGELCLDRVGKRFAWHVEKPLRYSCIIANGKLTQWDEDSDKTVSVPFSKYPLLEMLSDAMTAFASGDVKALEKDFEAAPGKDGSILLKPRSERFAASLITEVELFLDDTKTKIVKVIATEKSGDVTELVYTDSVFDSDIPDSLWQAKQK